MKNLLMFVFLAFFCSPIHAQSFIVGGSIWGEDDNNSYLNFGERGGYNVIVELRTVSYDLISTTKADSNGYYQFIQNSPGNYRVIIPNINFYEGGPLYGLSSCYGSGADDNIDNDDNGEYDPLGVVSEIINLQNFETDFTIDFCFEADCGLENPIVSTLCENGDTICDLNALKIYCAKMSKEISVGDSPNPLCADKGIAKNMSWVAFVAGNGNYTIEFEAFACVGGLNGAQLGVYEDCSFTKSIYCQSEPCFTGKQSISSTLFTPGKVYFLWINGCYGSVCRYQIEIKGDYSQFELPETNDYRCSTPFGKCDTVCLNDQFILDIGEKFNEINAQYSWIIGSPSNLIKNVSSNNRFLELKFSETGKHTVELSQISMKCSSLFSPVKIDVVVVDSLSNFCSPSDTCHVTVFDTIYTTITDTNFIDVPRFISVTDTLIINLNVPNSSNELVVNKISIYPNPSNSHIFIDMGNYSLLKNYELQILNALGQPVYFTPIEQQQYYIDLNQWTGKGTYFVRIKDSVGVTIVTKKIILH